VEIALAGILATQKLRCYKGIMTDDSVRLLSNEQLLLDLRTVAARERETTARLIALLSELDARRLYLAEGYASLFVYCTRCLHLSEHAAYGRTEAARAARKFPVILELLSAGSLTLTTVCLLASHLTADNHARVLAAARHKSKREVEQQVAALQPMPPVPSRVRKLPERITPSPLADTTASGSLEDVHRAVPMGETTGPAPTRPIRRAPAVVAPLAPERYKVQLTISADTHGKLRRVQDLLRHTVPDGDPATIFDRALTLLLADLETRKLAKVARPRLSTRAPAGGRYVRADVRREVWSRDGGQCAFVGAQGRCAEKGFLEFHHVIPFARGGPTSAANLQLRCRLCRYRHKRHYADWRIMPRRHRQHAKARGPHRQPALSSRHKPVHASLSFGR
jgi:5-methylcytosine-specific restriction endonuclease McrA